MWDGELGYADLCVGRGTRLGRFVRGTVDQAVGEFVRTTEN